MEENNIFDYKSGLSRFVNNKEIFEKYLRLFQEQNDFYLLKSALEKKDFEKAFNISHDMKSFTGSLGFKVLYEHLCELNELLRSNKDTEGAVRFFPKVEADYNRVIEVLEKKYF